ncbi:MAG: hypothetical protein Q7U04_01655, partial [Bacteriovorax sp.]|nr:hypothetical protein [Bacteriovorax sp.]
MISKLIKLLTNQVEGLGANVIEGINGLGAISLFTARFFYWSIRKPFRIHLFFEQLYFIGNKSMTIILL